MATESPFHAHACKSKLPNHDHALYSFYFNSIITIYLKENADTRTLFIAFPSMLLPTHTFL